MFKINFGQFIIRNVKKEASQNTRNIHSCICTNVSHREATAMSKIMHGSANPKKRVWYTESQQDKSLLNTGYKIESMGIAGGGKKNFRRQNVLNKLFMRHITEQMASDEVVCGRGIQITHVNVSADYKQVKVMWLCDSMLPNQSDINRFLENYSYTLRHRLSSLQLVGIVPPICFVYDKKRAQVVNVEKLLRVAEQGPKDEEHNINIHVSSVKVNNKSEQECLAFEDDWIPIPSMRHNVFDLDQAEIMAKVKSALKKHSKLADEKVFNREVAWEVASVAAVSEAVGQFRKHRSKQEQGWQVGDQQRLGQDLQYTGVEEEAIEEDLELEQDCDIEETERKI